MSEANDIGPREQAAASEVRALPEPRAREEFQADLRRRFVSGELAASAPPEEAGPAPSARVLPFPVRIAFPLALAAILAGLFFVMNRGPGWEPMDPTSGARLAIGERIYTASDPDLAAALVPGVHIAVVDEGMETFDLWIPGTVVMQITPGTEVVLPVPPRRWVGRRSSTRIEDGEVRFVTGPAFSGAHLTIDSPVARVEVTGTTLAVICTLNSTCVCVLEGDVEVREHRDDGVHAIPAGMRRTMFASRDAVAAEMLPESRMKLGMLREVAVPRLSP